MILDISVLFILLGTKQCKDRDISDSLDLVITGSNVGEDLSGLALNLLLITGKKSSMRDFNIKLTITPSTKKQAERCE
jgi:hypothetical protein